MLRTLRQLAPERRSRKSTALLTLLIFSFLSWNLHATNYTWSKSDGPGNWNNPANWTPNGIPDIADNVTINNGGTVLYNVSGGGSVNSLTLSNGSTISGNDQLTVASDFYWNDGTIGGTGPMVFSGFVYLEGIGNMTISGKTLSVFGEMYWNSGNLNIISGGKLSLENGAVMVVEHFDEQFIGGETGGTFELSEASIIKTQSCNTIINCAFSVSSGIVDIESGTLAFGALSNSQLTDCTFTLFSGKKLEMAYGEHNFGNNSKVQGSAGEFNIMGATINLNGNNTISSILNLSAGELGGTSNANISGTFNWSGGNIASYATTTVSNIMNMTGSATKALSNGTLSLSGTANWTDGNFNIGSGALFSTVGGSNFNVQHTGNQTLGSAASGTVTIGGSLTKSEASITHVTGNFNLSGGTLKINNGTFQPIAGSTGNYSGSIQLQAAAIMDVNGGTHTVNAGGIGSNGKFKVSGGSTEFTTGTTLSTELEVTGGTITATTNLTPKTYAQSGGTFNGSGSPTVSGSMLWSSGTISGTGTMTVNGITTFTAGMRTLDTKYLMLNGDSNWSGGDFTFANMGTVKQALSKTMTVDHTGTQAASGTGMMEIAGTIEKTYATSTTNVDIGFTLTGLAKGNGTITFGTLTNAGTVAPGFSPGKLTVNNFNNTNGLLQMEIQSTGVPGTAFDQLSITNTGVLGGTMTVTLLNGFIPAVDDQFQVVACNSCTGTFTTLTLPALPSDRFWATEYGGTGLLLKVLALLPVELTDFSASSNNGLVLLDWATESELNNRGFGIERSTDGTAWQQVGFVEGSGTTTQRITYRFTDEPAQPGIFYYRLRQMDFDGKEQLSQVRSVRLEEKGEPGSLNVYPNPMTGNELWVDLTFATLGTVYLQIVDAQGKLVQGFEVEKTSIQNTHQFSGLQLQPGLYHLVMNKVGGKTAIPFVVKG